MGVAAAAALTSSGVSAAVQILRPAIAARTSFALLDRVGFELGREPLRLTAPLLSALAATGHMGSWPVLGSVLSRSLRAGLEEPLHFARHFICGAQVWYVTDILGERVAGQALVLDLMGGMPLLTPWQVDACPWVRRALGVAGHFWAKRCATSASGADVRLLLEFLSPSLQERDIDAAKGIGWALKTLGRYRPDLVTPWLLANLATSPERPGAIVLRKAVTYLSEQQRNAMLTVYRHGIASVASTPLDAGRPPDSAGEDPKTADEG